VLWRRRKDGLYWDDRTLILNSLMVIQAKLEEIELLLREEDDGEGSEES